MELWRFQRGDTPVLLSMPHCGTHLPPEIAARMSDRARTLPDTDWHLDRLYNFAPALGTGFLVPTHSRYVVDLNRDPDGRSVYEDVANTGVVPVQDFDGQPLYQDGAGPDAAEMAGRIAEYWRPYHAKLWDELQALRARHGVAVLFEAHSIRSRVPRLFQGQLPDFCLGTADGTTADKGLTGRLLNVLRADDDASSELNGRFKGGYSTRLYGRPREGIHAVQLEIGRHLYMDEEAPFRFRSDRAGEVRPVIEMLVRTLIDWAMAESGRRRSRAAE